MFWMKHWPYLQTFEFESGRSVRQLVSLLFAATPW